MRVGLANNPPNAIALTVAAAKIGVLHHWRYRRLLLSTTVTTLGSSMAPIALAFAILDSGGSPTAFGAVLAANALAFATLLPLGGVFADRSGRIDTIIAANIVCASAQCITACLLILGTPDTGYLVAASLIRGAGGAFLAPAMGGVVPATVDRADIQPATSLLYVSSNTAAAVGPAIGGLLVAAAGPAWGIVADATSFVAAAILLSPLRGAQMHAIPGDRRNVLSDFVQGIAAVRDRSWLIICLISSSIVVFWAVAPFEVLGPAISRQSFDGPAAWGSIQSAYAIGAILGVTIAIRWRPHKPLVAATLVSVLYMPMLASLAAPAPLLVVIGASALAGGANDLYLVLYETTLQREVPERLLSRVSSLDWLANRATKPFALLAAGPAAAALGTSTIMWIACVAVVLCAGLNLTVPSLRHLEADR